MTYLVDGISTQGEKACGCWVNVQGNCPGLCNNLITCDTKDNPCSTYCYSQICNPKQGPLVKA